MTDKEKVLLYISDKVDKHTYNIIEAALRLDKQDSLEVSGLLTVVLDSEKYKPLKKTYTKNNIIYIKPNKRKYAGVLQMYARRVLKQ